VSLRSSSPEVEGRRSSWSGTSGTSIRHGLSRPCGADARQPARSPRLIGVFVPTSWPDRAEHLPSICPGPVAVGSRTGKHQRFAASRSAAQNENRRESRWASVMGAASGQQGHPGPGGCSSLRWWCPPKSLRSSRPDASHHPDQPQPKKSSKSSKPRRRITAKVKFARTGDEYLTIGWGWAFRALVGSLGWELYGSGGRRAPRAIGSVGGFR